MVENILIIGSGGREHAVCKAFLESDSSLNLFVLPGNAGTALIAKNILHINLNNHSEVIDFCQQQNIDLVFIGPEQPLVNGLVDDLQKNTVLNEVKLKNIRLFTEFIKQVFRAYYSDKQVLSILNVGASPPFPEGNRIVDDDWAILMPVYERGKIYKDID